MEDLESGQVWEIHSRNLRYGVWVKEKQGFIGIRTKFGDRYLFMEFHWDTGPPFGTAKHVRLVGQVPEGIDLVESYWDDNAEQGHKIIPNKALFDYLDDNQKDWDKK